MGWRERLVRLMAIVAAACLAGHADALPWRLAIGQYKHTRWTVDNGAPRDITSITQSRNGFLWIGSGVGLFRFDGITFDPIRPERQIGDRSGISVVLAARDGSVWVGYRAGGIARYRNGGLRDAGAPADTPYVMKLVQGRDGAIWALLGRSERQLLRYANGRWQEVGQSAGLPNGYGIDLRVARDGTLWLSTLGGLFRMKDGTVRFERAPEVPVEQGRLAESTRGDMWLIDRAGARVVSGPRTMVPYPMPYTPRTNQAIFDRDGDLWGPLGKGGIFRLRAPSAQGELSAAAAADKVETFGISETLTSDVGSWVFEDREGSIWVGTSLGLDRFRRPIVVAESRLTERPLWGANLLSAPDGSVFVGQADGVYRIRPGGDPQRIITGHGETETICMGGDRMLWIVQHDRIVGWKDREIAGIAKPVTRQAVVDCAVDGKGVLNLTAEEGLFRRAGTGWRLVTAWEGPPSDVTSPMLARRDGSLLVYLSSEALRRYDYPDYTTLRLVRPGALRFPNMITEAGDDVLLGGRFGLGRLRGTRISFIDRSRIAELGFVGGLIRTARHGTWLLGGGGIARASTEQLDRGFDDQRRKISLRLYDYHDGSSGGSNRYTTHAVAQGGDGRLWFSTTSGILWVHPESIRRNTASPPVVITAINANGAVRRDPGDMELPSGSTRLNIDFAALSLAVPDRVRLRYRLEGADGDWVDPGKARRASYTNLGPGRYRFQVIAANDDGVWNRTGATLNVTIPPTFIQSIWFKLLCAVVMALLLWTAYRIRVRQLTARVRDRMGAQLAERERIARELHDTLLQGFQGLMLRFQSVANRMTPDNPLRASLDVALERAEGVLTEGRRWVGELRFSDSPTELSEALAAVARELGGPGHPDIAVTVEGSSRELEPMVREELLRIGEEALGNALRHAAARHVHIALLYGATEFQLGVHDDGAGLPEAVVEAGGREGHFGLIGMRERATLAGGRLTLTSRRGTGTEVRVTVPGRLAYRAQSRPKTSDQPAIAV